MSLEQSLQSETPNQESVLARFARSSRAKLTAFILAIASMTGCATANVPNPAQKKSAMRDDAVEEACSKLGRIQVSGKKMPSELSELNKMCMEKNVLEAQMAQLKRQGPKKAQQ